MHREALGAVRGLLGDLVTALGERAMGSGLFRRVLEAGLGELTLGRVPPSLDQVLVGQIERSRHPRLRAALVLGMGEGSFPQLSGVQAILTDEDRRTLGESDASADAGRAVQVAPGRSELLFDEDLMAYLALTRPGERLWVSWASSDDAGRAGRPSRYVRRLRRLFAGVPVTRPGEADPAATAVTPGELAATLAARIRGRTHREAPASVEAGLYELLRGLAGRDDPAWTAMHALDYTNAPALSGTAARGLFTRGDGALAGSVSRMESYAACPFQHFARLGLRLGARDRLEMDAPKLGQLYHHLLARLYAEMGRGEPVNWGTHPRDEMRRLITQLVADARDRLDSPRLTEGARGYLLAQSETILAELADALHAAGVAAPTLQQVAAELDFGLSRDATLGALRIDLGRGDRLALRGRIDRVDVDDAGRAFVIDYKSGPQRVDWSRLAHGLSLQLPGYLLALEGAGERWTPAGAFFQPITAAATAGHPPSSADEPPQESERLAAYRRRGLFDAEAAPVLDGTVQPGGPASPFVTYKLAKSGNIDARASGDAITGQQLRALLAHARGRMVEFGRSILAGRVAVEPYRLGNRSPCGWCELRAVCRLDFDYNTPRYLDTRKRGEVLAELEDPA